MTGVINADCATTGFHHPKLLPEQLLPQEEMHDLKVD